MWESFNSRLDKWAWERPDHTAVIQAARRISYRKLYQHANALAKAWGEGGIASGDRIVSYCGNTLEAIIAMAACRRCGAVFVPLHPSTKPSKLARLLQELEPVVLIASRGKLSDLRRVAPELAIMPKVLLSDIDSVQELPPGSGGEPRNEFDVHAFWPCCGDIHAEHCAPVDLDPDAPAAILYTVDDSGAPRGVVLSGENLAFTAEAANRYVGNTPDDVVLNSLAISLGHGFQQVLATLRAGATLVLEPSFAYPAAVLQQIEETKATGFPLVPSMAAILLSIDAERFDLSSLRYIVNLCGPLAAEHTARLNEVFGHARLLSVYGRIECLHTACAEPQEEEFASTRVGKAFPGVEASVVDKKRRRAKPESDGRLYVRGPNVMLEYWRQPEATGRVLRVDAKTGSREFRCDDVFRTDLDENLYFVDRTDDLIDIGGEFVSPKEVEATLRAHPSVVDAVVYGDEDEIYRDRRVCAVVRLNRGDEICDRELQRFCAEHLEDFMVPALIRVRHSAIPKGKLHKAFGRKTQEAKG